MIFQMKEMLSALSLASVLRFLLFFGISAAYFMFIA